MSRLADDPVIRICEGSIMDGNLALASRLVEESPVPAMPALEQALNRVEYYQPLYGINGFEAPLRGCRDRALAIAAELGHVQADVRLVDFGSSLGYFPFFFADRGAVTTGFDINPRNTAVALATKRLNGLTATFKTAALDLELVRGILPGQYDVTLILSVLHHITHQKGIDYVTQLVSELLERIPTLVLELAHRNETVQFPWQRSLPEDPLEILSASPDVQVKLLGHFPTHLSRSTRPMYLITR
jgi:O-antigen chain-terminating methyltransferase